MSYQQKQVVKLTQEQSKVLDGITDWNETGKTIKWNDKVTGEPKSFYKKYEEKILDDNTLEAQNIFVNLGLSIYDKVESFSGVYTYTIGKDRIEKEKTYRRDSSSSPSTYSSNSNKSNVDWDEINRKREERDKVFEQRHEESMLGFKAVIDALTINSEKTENNSRKLEDLYNLLAEQNRAKGAHAEE